MPPIDNKPYNLTERASQRNDEQATRQARQLESDDANEGSVSGNTVSPDGDEAGENRVTTSLSED
ncbi:MAG TPA: hypothetical protein VFT06_01945 [Flavisolibacter sp.]|nr:hypothetical protein [Flavisolibacter sp.]